MHTAGPLRLARLVEHGARAQSASALRRGDVRPRLQDLPLTAATTWEAADGRVHQTGLRRGA